ncbi:ABC transporter ATP-binding protein [Lactobacillus xylocopicola]|uniref:Peptide ABC transporter ATP-binding protein n=1 Tax=Lactobacillus xylocopicola TaxID=2976676 RepID=A0ABN6SHI6_9LACO|nr:ATP-binding cassette domain-containing protein [Lactobacillus xylocopicola]BDR59785.1 peptide ABC transporter ATP-binding protein [Lactobacillus xylocopicola]
MLIEIENLSKQYQKVISARLFHKQYQEFDAVKGVSLNINPGERVGLVGLNGSGKSTLIKLILGILQPSQGQVKTFGSDPIANRQKNARKIGVVFGQRSQLRWDLPAMDTFKLNRELYQVSEKDFTQRVAQLSRLLDAGDFLLQPVRNLSLGQRMKAEFIAALIHDPELIILDEPTIGLDVLSKNSIVNFLQTLTDKTILFTSHDLDEVEKVCSRIVILNQGRLVLNKDSQELADLAVPATITFASKTSSYDDLTARWPLERLDNGDYQLANVSQKDIKRILSELTAAIPIDHIEVKSGKLEYLLAHTATAGVNQ